MKKILLIFLCLFNILFAEGFTLKSSDISGQLSNKQVFNEFGCKGENISPLLYWRNAPKGTKSFALTMYDADAPTGSGWWHWVVFNIPLEIRVLDSGFGNQINKDSQIDTDFGKLGFTELRNLGIKNGKHINKSIVQSVTDFGKVGYGGACPPIGSKPHQYIFTIYALNVEKLELTQNATPALVGFYINSHLLAKSSIVAYYGR
jgi:Raf kinase inhibitor-like YbhB/YbcL family protein